MGKVLFLNIHDLYDTSVCHSKEIRPWAINGNGVDALIIARYEFVERYMQKGQNISEEEIKQTDYWYYMNKGIDEMPRDGGAIWVYSDPMRQAKRFIALIDSIYSHGYNTDKYPDVIEAFEGREDLRFRYTKYLDIPTMFENDYTKRPYAGIMTVREVKGAYAVWNGLHRLAILKYLCDKGSIAGSTFPVISLEKEEKNSLQVLRLLVMLTNRLGLRRLRGWIFRKGRGKAKEIVRRNFLDC